MTGAPLPPPPATKIAWRTAEVVDVVWETKTTRTLTLDVPGWPGHRAGQHVDVRLTADDGYQTERSYSIAPPPEAPPVPAQLPPPQRPGNNVYFIHPRGAFYVADMVQIDPLLRQRDLFLVSHGAELDEQLIRQNWPSAVKIASQRAADQWYLGPRDQRLPVPGKSGQQHFVIGKPIPPSAAGR